MQKKSDRISLRDDLFEASRADAVGIFFGIKRESSRHQLPEQLWKWFSWERLVAIWQQVFPRRAGWVPVDIRESKETEFSVWLPEFSVWLIALPAIRFVRQAFHQQSEKRAVAELFTGNRFKGNRPISGI